MGMLKGLKILDFTTLLPGPYATMMFADMGADVIRIESKVRQDLVREMDPVDEQGISYAHRQLNRSKRSLTLNLKKEASIQIIHKLVQEYDVIIEQFRPGVMERLGLSYEVLKRVNPAIIYCSVTGYGQTGPYRDRPGHDNNYLALSGVLDYSRRKGEKPSPLGIQIADLAGGSMHAVIGILAAAFKREKTGEGEYIDISMTDAVFTLNALYGPGYLSEGVIPKAEELLLNGGSFYDYYETKDGRFYSVGSLEPQFKELLCKTIGDEALIALGMNEEVAEQNHFKQRLKEVFKGKTFAEWQLILGEDFQGCVEPVLTFQEATKHKQLQARDMIVQVGEEDDKSIPQIASPIKFKNTEAVYKHIGPPLGQHITEVLLAQGFTKEQITKWKEEGVFS